jgi:hypothetical protein
VTYEDGSELEQEEEFEKTWRLRNSGTCPWNTTYSLVFDHGDQMDGPSTQALEGVVSPGSTVDISVDLVAPDESGEYKGYWKLQTTGGVTFGLGEDGDIAFWVEIIVVKPGPKTVTLTPVASQSGSVLSDGTVKSVWNVGDRASNLAAQVFLAFDISDIPEDADIDKVKVNFKDFSTEGKPFDNLGCLRMYPHNYGTLGGGDFVPNTPTPSGVIVKWCNKSQMQTPEFDTDVEHAMEEVQGKDWFKVRLQFKEKLTDNDGNPDLVKLGNVKLIVTYETQ